VSDEGEADSKSLLVTFNIGKSDVKPWFADAHGFTWLNEQPQVG
jgi:hypothetical protein